MYVETIHIFIYLYIVYIFINNMDMIKISHVMTLYINIYMYIVYMCITSFFTYTTLYNEVFYICFAS